MKDSSQVPTLWLHFDLDAGGMYTVTKFAKDYGNWALKIEDAIIVAIGVPMQCNARISRDNFLNREGLKRYTNLVSYDVTEDSYLVL